MTCADAPGRTSGASTTPARRDALWAAAVLLITAGYLAPFVTRGWIPHDEGTVAGAAVRLLRGELPHAGFQDLYTGGMTWFYAGLFQLFGVDLAVIRWALYGAALACVVAWYRIARELAPPALSALAALTCLAWAFPNYFGGIPSWWVLTFASAAIVAFARYVAGGRLAWLLACGFLLGLACTFKQTAAYVVAAAALGVAFHESGAQPLRDGPRPLDAPLAARLAIAGSVLAGLGMVLSLNPSMASLMLLVSPAAFLTLIVVADERRRASAGTGRVRALMLRLAALGAGVAIPLSVLSLPYVARGLVGEFAYGAFVLPARRGADASFDMGSPVLTIAYVAYIVGVVHLLRDTRAPRTRDMPGWTAWLPLLLVLAAGWTVPGYRFVWNAVRFALLALAPLVVVTMWRAPGEPRRQAVGFTVAAMAAFLALFQFPFPAPIYFCFAAPLVLLTLLAALRASAVAPRTLAPLFVALGVFGVFLNQGYAANIGLRPAVERFDTPLALPDASLHVSADDAAQYRRVVSLVQAHARSRYIHAFPDCPEIYYLTGLDNPTPSSFDFFWPIEDERLEAFWAERGITAVVVNHTPGYSRPPTARTLELARQVFPLGERVGRFEVRWRVAAINQ